MKRDVCKLYASNYVEMVTHWMANCNGRCQKIVKLKLRHVYYAIVQTENMRTQNCIKNFIS